METRLPALFFVLLLYTSSAAQSLSPGQRAPRLGDVRWLSGRAIESFEQGKVHVIEFWSTWCGACVDAIPHMNMLAERYSDEAVFIAVHVRHNKNSPSPEAFLSKRLNTGEPVYKFAVAEDVNDITAKRWLDTTYTSGFPTAFILDRSSRLVWFGHAGKLDEPLRQVAEGTYDLEAAVRQMNRRIRAGRLESDSERAIDAGDYDRGIDLFIQAWRESPGDVVDHAPGIYGFLLFKSRDREVAARLVKRMTPVGERRVDPMLLVGFARVMHGFEPEELSDLVLAKSLLERASKLDFEYRYYAFEMLAKIRWAEGNYEGAIEAQRRAIGYASNPEIAGTLTTTLENYQRSLTSEGANE